MATKKGTPRIAQIYQGSNGLWYFRVDQRTTEPENRDSADDGYRHAEPIQPGHLTREKALDALREWQHSVANLRYAEVWEGGMPHKGTRSELSEAYRI